MSQNKEVRISLDFYIDVTGVELSENPSLQEIEEEFPEAFAALMGPYWSYQAYEHEIREA